MSWNRLLVVAAVSCGGGARTTAPAVAPPPAPVPAAALTLASLAPGAEARGFVAEARYVDNDGKPVGGRFRHRDTGFLLDTVAIDSAPQAFIWVNSLPTSNQGEPHTQEHLLLGKGNKGRTVANLEEMLRGESSAFTDQHRTCYHLNATVEANFWPLLRSSVDGLLNPDYTDEEIRREVRHIGVSEQKDGSLVLEEKGTVYQEMARTYEQAVSLAWREAETLVYGAEHPLAMSAGGWPADIRGMTAEDIRKFHAEHYHLANMGAILSIAPSTPLDEVLRRTDEMLDGLAGRTGPVITEADLAAPAGASPGQVKVVDYPFASATNPSPLLLVWPATRTLAPRDRVLLELFLDSLAGDESTELYKLLIDTKTRKLDTGANGIFSYVLPRRGLPVVIGLNDVPPRAATPADAERVRAEVVAALRRIADAPDGSPAVAEINARVASRLTDRRRLLAKDMASPPGFGNRDTGASFMEHLELLATGGGFERSLTMRADLEAIEKLLAAPANPWRTALRAWGLVDVAPHIVSLRPSPEMLAREARERQERLDTEAAAIQRRTGAPDAAEALRRFAAEEKAKTVELEAAARKVPLPPFTDTPPMTYDDTLRAESGEVGGVPRVAAEFAGMAGGEVGLAFRLDGVAEADLFYLALLPELMSEVGIAGGGEVIAYDEMTERLRKEILALTVEIESDSHSGRLELVVRASGNDLDESRRALAWMQRILLAPDWRAENLPRLRDVAARMATRLRARMSGPEEGWAMQPPEAVWLQNRPEYLHAESFLTRAHDAHRLRWLLEEPQPLDKFMSSLAKSGKLGRAGLEKLTAALEKPGDPRWKSVPAAARPTALKAVGDLGHLLDDLPDDALARDWQYLCAQIAADLARPPAETLAGLDRVRHAVVRAGNARAWTAASPAAQVVLDEGLGALVAKLEPGQSPRQRYGDTPRVQARVAERTGKRETPRYVGLVNRSTGVGLAVVLGKAAHVSDRDDEPLLRYLAGNLYAGHGSHGLFMKTWAAGLAYSNGVRPRPIDGRITYYAERSPKLPDTLRFVGDQVRDAEVEAPLLEYAVAQAFTSRAADSYEERAAEYAAELADGVTPEVVRGFREKILELRRRPDLLKEVASRVEAVHGGILPGYGPPSLRRPDAVYFFSGPESQLAALESWLREREGPTTTVQRLYPRDFWIPR